MIRNSFILTFAVWACIALSLLCLISEPFRNTLYQEGLMQCGIAHLAAVKLWGNLSQIGDIGFQLERALIFIRLHMNLI
jgi:hypothetical protein